MRTVVTGVVIQSWEMKMVTRVYSIWINFISTHLIVVCPATNVAGLPMGAMKNALG
jgi:hypothetical protein